MFKRVRTEISALDFEPEKPDGPVEVWDELLERFDAQHINQSKMFAWMRRHGIIDPLRVEAVENRTLTYNGKRYSIEKFPTLFSRDRVVQAIAFDQSRPSRRMWDFDPFLIDDLDFSNPSALKMSYAGEWRSLERYDTRAEIILSDFVYHGAAHRYGWHEWFTATATVRLPYPGCTTVREDFRKPLICLGDRGPEIRVAEARFEVKVMPDSYFEKRRLAWKKYVEADSRAREEGPVSSDPSPSPRHINMFLTLEEENAFKRQLDPRTDDIKESHSDDTIEFLRRDRGNLVWPELILTPRSYNRFLSGIEKRGFDESEINLPPDQFSGLRRALADFGMSQRFVIEAIIQAFGMNVDKEIDPWGYKKAEFAVIPNSASISGFIHRFRTQDKSYDSHDSKRCSEELFYMHDPNRDERISSFIRDMLDKTR